MVTQNTWRTLRPAVTCLGPTDPCELSKKGCRESWGWLPTTESASGGHTSHCGLFAAEKASCNVQCRAGFPDVKSASGDVVGVGQDQVPGSHHQWVEPSSPGQCSFKFGCVGEGTTQEWWRLSVGYTGGRLHRGIIEAVTLALIMNPQNLVFPCMSLAPLELPPLCESPEWGPVRESVCRPFKRISRFPGAFHLTWMGGILAVFHSQMLWGFLFLALDPWVGELGVRLRPLTPQKGPLLPRCPSRCSTTTCGCGASLFCISAPPASLNVASSLY